MPMLRPRRERFAEGLAAGKTYKEAAELAGYSARSATCLGSQLAKEPEIVQRVTELRNETRRSLGAYAASSSQAVTVLDGSGAVAGIWIPVSAAVAAKSDN